MRISSRLTYIRLTVGGYLVAALAWIFFSDNLLGAFEDLESALWLSTAKGFFFVLSSAGFLYFTLLGLPAESAEAPVASPVAEERRDRSWPAWLNYFFAVALVFVVAFIRGQAAGVLGEQPFLLLYMLPVLLAALLGGLGPGLLATATAALLAAHFQIRPHGSLAIHSTFDLIQWFMLIVNGLLVSLVSAVMHGARDRAQRRWADLKAVNTALRASEDRFRKLFQDAPVAMGQVGRDGKILGQNCRFDQLFGYTLADMPTIDHWWRLAYPNPVLRRQAMDRWEAAQEKAIAQGTDVRAGEFAVVCKDGSERLVQITGIVLEDGVLSTFVDMTERRRAEARLRLWAEVFENAHLDLAISDARSNTVIVANPAFARRRGYEPGEMEGMSVLRLFPEDVAKGGFDFLPGLKDLTHAIFETEHATKDGRRFPVRLDLTVMRDEDGHPLNRIVHALDLTESRRAEDALRRSEELFRNLFERHAAVKLLIDPKTGEIVDANRAAASFYGWSREQLRGMNIGSINTLPSETVREEIEQAVNKGHSRFEFRHKMVNGSVRDVDVLSSLIEAEDRQLLHSIVVDITERKEAERALVKAKDDAECASRAKSEFLANMSHEIRTPLNGIMGMVQLLEITSAMDEQREYLNLAKRSADRLTRLLSNILDLSSIESGKLDIRREAFECSNLFGALADLFSITARDRNLALTFRIDPGIPSGLVGDEARVQQVLFNLVGNALKFTHQGGVIVEAAFLRPVGRMGMRVLFSVSDTGIGIPDDKLATLFKPFTQVEGAYTRSYQGAGLGLAIVRRLVMLMDGRMCVENFEEGGTTFHVVLPFGTTGPEFDRGEELRAAEGASSGRLRILLAEDEPLNQFAMTSLLTTEGHRVTLAEDGVKVLEVLSGEEFDCILMDIQMPVLNGLDATRRIRALSSEPLRDIPIIALTACCMPEERRVFLGAGMNDCLCKPVVLDELRRVLEGIAPQARPQVKSRP